MIFKEYEKIANSNKVGGKAKNLAKLKIAGFNVPEFVVFSYEFVTQEIGEITNMNHQDQIEALILPEQLVNEVINDLELDDNSYVAVRSSALEEDGKEYSFAGQFESILYVKPKNLAEAIKQVWLSVFSEHVKTYLSVNNLNFLPKVSVIIQQMIPADCSGVGFGINPVTGNRKGKVVSALFGLGEGLVSGKLNADTYTLEEKWVVDIADKNTKLAYDIAQSQVVETPVKEKNRNEPALKNQQLEEVKVVLEKLEKHFKIPQDIEFCYFENKLYLLQTRPITNLNKVVDKGDAYIVWDNSNIIESYPGVTTPLTFSFIKEMYTSVYIQFCELMGVHPEDISKNKKVFENMLGLMDGRVYYNLLSWYRVLALLPGYSVNAEFMEKMMGVKERFDLPKDRVVISPIKAKYRLLISIIKIIKQFRKLPKERDAFITFLEEVMKRYNAIELHNKSANELMVLYHDFERVLLEKWKPPLVNDFFAMIFFGVLEKTCIKNELPPNIHNDLLCGSQDIISTEPVTLLLAISTKIQKEESCRLYFEQHSAEDIWKGISKFPEINKDIKDYIAKFGDRCVGELKLETISYSEDPITLVNIIKSYVKQKVKSNDKGKQLEKSLRSNAEEVVQKQVKGFVKKGIFRYVLKRTRTLVSNRENLRYERTRAFGMVRKIFSAIGNRFYAEGIINHPRDIFYLKKEEIFDFIQGTSVDRQIKGLIEKRKEEFTGYNNQEVIPAERFATYGMVYHANDFYNQSKVEDFEGELKGIGACPGQITGEVQVIMDPKEVNTLDGKILVTSSTDPGWVTLFPTSSAIIVERGSLLSHSAIVSRELGIPCVVGVTGLLKRLKTGDKIKMDGSTGEIKILTDEETTAI